MDVNLCPWCAVLLENVAGHLHCPRCGSGVGSTHAGIAPSGEAQPAPPPEPAPDPETHVAPVVRLLPSQRDAAMEKRQEVMLAALREMYARVVAGEIDGMVIATVNSKQATSPYSFKWAFRDPVAMAGALSAVTRLVVSEPFVRFT